MLTNHLDLNLPNQPLSKPKPALQASAFFTYFLLEAILYLILCSCCLTIQSASFHCLLANLYPFQCLCLFDVMDIIHDYVMNVCFKDLFTSHFSCKCLFYYCLYYSLFSLEHGLQTTPWFRVSVPQRSCIQGRATWSLQLELWYANTIQCTEVISSPYGLNVQLWEVILESLKSRSKYPYFVPSFLSFPVCG